MDYKKEYLEQKKQSLVLEMNLMQMRSQIIQEELPKIEAELEEHANKNEEPNTE